MSSQNGAIKYKHTRSSFNSQAKKEIGEDCFRDEIQDEYDPEYAERLQATSREMFELRASYEEDTPVEVCDLPVISIDELCRERIIPIAGREGHLVSICRKQKQPWGFQIRDFTEHHFPPENRLDIIASMILSGFAYEARIQA